MVKDSMSTSISILVLICILLFGLIFYKEFNIRLKANQLSRKSILKLESQGSLPESYVQEIKGELGKLGLKNITVYSNSAKNTYKNGEDVFVIIEFDQITKKFSNFKFSDEVRHHRIPRSSTSKN